MLTTRCSSNEETFTTPGASLQMRAIVAAVTSAATTAATKAVARPVFKFMLGVSGAELVGSWHFKSEDVVGLDPIGRAVDKPGLGAFGLLLGASGLGRLCLPGISRRELAVTHCRTVLSC